MFLVLMFVHIITYTYVYALISKFQRSFNIKTLVVEELIA